MIARYAILISALVATNQARSETLDIEAARRFVIGKQFAFTCFDGSHGVGRIFADGSIVGAIQVRGTGKINSLSLPPGTIRVKGDAICGSLRGAPIELCFDLDKTDDHSFRGYLSGLHSAYCKFTKIVEQPLRRKWSEPLSLDPERWRRAGP